MKLSSRFASHSPAIRSNSPLSNEQIASVAPSIFAAEAHESRSARYTYIPTIDVLDGLRKEGFQPFMVAQTKVRNLEKKDFTKHMIRLRHASQIAGSEANEIILLNSHDGSSSYQMLAGMLRFVCMNGMVCGENLSEIRVPHKGQIVNDVIEGAFRVLDSFEIANQQKEGMQALALSAPEQTLFAKAAISLKYDFDEKGYAPVTEDKVLSPRRFEDRKSDLWTTFNRVQENLMKGGLPASTANGRRTTTRPVQGIDTSVKLNRALWMLAEGMKALRG